MSVRESIFENILNEEFLMTKKLSQFQLKQILSSSNPIAEIESRKDEFFDFIDRYMVGCELCFWLACENGF